MVEKSIQLADELFQVYQERKVIEKREKTLKEQLLKFFEKTEDKKITSERYIMEFIHRITYDVPTPKELIDLMGEKFASLYLIVDKKVRQDLPPVLQSKLCPVKMDTTYIEIRPRRIENESNSNNIPQDSMGY